MVNSDRRIVTTSSGLRVRHIALLCRLHTISSEQNRAETGRERRVVERESGRNNRGDASSMRGGGELLLLRRSFPSSSSMSSPFSSVSSPHFASATSSSPFVYDRVPVRVSPSPPRSCSLFLSAVAFPSLSSSLSHARSLAADESRVRAQRVRPPTGGRFPRGARIPFRRICTVPMSGSGSGAVGTPILRQPMETKIKGQMEADIVFVNNSLGGGQDVRINASDLKEWKEGSKRWKKNECSDNSTPVSALRSPDLVELEYADLNLKDMYGASELGHVRIRQHVNPLSSSFAVPVQVPDWKAIFRDPMMPLMVDIGCGSGRFLIWLAKNNTEQRNYLGLEIRQKLVERSQFWSKELGLENIYFLFANATVSFEQLVSTYPGPLTLVSILCPDPHFKQRHHKRRVVQPPLVDSISKNLNIGGKVFLQSDVLEVASDMRNQFDSRSDVFEHVDAIDTNMVCDDQGWILNNPMGIRTEREIHAELEGAKIYRRMYQKKRHYVPSA